MTTDTDLDIVWIIEQGLSGGMQQATTINEHMDTTMVRHEPAGVPPATNPPPYLEGEGGTIYPSTDLADAVRALDPDIVMVHCFSDRAINAVPEISTFATTVFRVGVNTAEVAIAKPQTNEFIVEHLSAFDHIVCASDAARRRIRAAGIDNRRLSVMPTAVDLSEDVIEEPRRDVPHTIGLLQRLAPAKSPQMPIFALRALSEIEPTIAPRIEIAGAGSDRQIEAFNGLAVELRIHHDTIFHGWVDNVHDFLRDCGVLILPSVTENFPQSVLEAAQVGTPVIAGEAAWTDEYDSLITFTPDDPWELAEILGDLLTNEAKRYRVAKDQQQEAQAKFHVEDVVEDYIDLFEGLHDQYSKFKLPGSVKA